jgi:hypothetical protein
MRLTPRNAALIAMAATALAPAAAGAKPVPADHSGCGKDYSMNSATGDYCKSLTDTSSSTVEPPAPLASSGNSDFAWGDAAVGAGGALALVVLAGGAATVTRRRFPATG